ncbi:MAG: hypothetical protein ACI9H6_000525 [Patiriisocius sp.]|jgi:hypothetical protein
MFWTILDHMFDFPGWRLALQVLVLAAPGVFIFYKRKDEGWYISVAALELRNISLVSAVGLLIKTDFQSEMILFYLVYRLGREAYTHGYKFSGTVVTSTILCVLLYIAIPLL